MNSKLLLVQAITLLYRESQLTGTHENSAQLAREIINAAKPPEVNLGFDHEYEIIIGLRATAIWMAEQPLDYQYELNEILQRVRVNVMDEDGLYQALYDGMAPELTDNVLKKTCLNMKRTLNDYFKEEKLKQIVWEAAHELRNNRNKIFDMKKWVAKLVGNIEPYQVDNTKKDPAIISEVDTGNAEQLTKIFSNVVDEETGLSILKLGHQGINRLTDGGWRRGEFVTMTALEHQNKSGYSLTAFSQVALYNIPQLIDPTKKPLLLRISFEDTVEMNYQFLYRNLKENETGVLPDTSGISPEEMAAYVNQRLSVNGYHTRFLEVNPSMWTYKDICNKILELEADGYEVHMCMVDYLLKVPTTGCDGISAGEPLRNMFERIKAFMKARRITFVTPHQLSTEAKNLQRLGSTDFVKLIAKGSYYAGSKQLSQVIDLEMFFHIETVNNESYFTVHRGKHRKNNQTPIEHHYCVLKFNGAGGLLDDVLGQDTTRKKVGGGVIGSGDETPFWGVEDL